MTTDIHTQGDPLAVDCGTRFQGKRILLRGFDGPDESLAIRTLTEAGGNLVQTLQTADVVVIGPSGAPKVVTLARQRQLKVISWSELESEVSEDSEESDMPIETRPAVEITADSVRILDVLIPYPGTPPPLDAGSHRFRNLCLDEPFLKTVRAVALGAVEQMPTALEGSTAASKTTAVLWLAHLLGQPVFRLNLNGQTDTGELIGRYVPTRGGEEWDLQALAALVDCLRKDSRSILARAKREHRPLNWAERSFIIAREGFHQRNWRFAEGIIPQALRTGTWVLMDELNLAEPQILERLNPLLDSPPSLLLSEGDLTHWGPGGLPVHSGFRLFATLNPAEYSGRSILSPAFRDRWVNWFHATSPGQKEYEAQLRFLIHGIQPSVLIGQARYQAPAGDPLFPELSDVPEIQELIRALAQFHSSMALAGGEAGQAPSFGRHRRERYVFTRRSLEACARLWNSLRNKAPRACPRSLLGSAIDTVYFNKVSPGADRKAAQGMAQVAGLPLMG